MLKFHGRLITPFLSCKVHVCSSEHSDLSFVYRVIHLIYGLGTLTTYFSLTIAIILLHHYYIAWLSDVGGFDPHVRQHFFVEFGHEIVSTAILSLPLIQEGQLSVTGDRICTKYW